MRNPAAEQIDRHLQSLFGRGAGLDPRGNTCLEFKNGVQLHIEVPENFAHGFVHGEVGAADEATIRRALELNHFGVAPAGAWLALDPETSVLRLCATLSVNRPEALDAALTGMLSGIEVARKRLSAVPGSPQPAHHDDQLQFEADSFLIRI